MGNESLGILVTTVPGPGVLHELSGVIARHNGDITSVEILESRPPEGRIYFEIEQLENATALTDELRLSRCQRPPETARGQRRPGRSPAARCRGWSRARSRRRAPDELAGSRLRWPGVIARLWGRAPKFAVNSPTRRPEDHSHCPRVPREHDQERYDTPRHPRPRASGVCHQEHNGQHPRQLSPLESSRKLGGAALGRGEDHSRDVRHVHRPEARLQHHSEVLTSPANHHANAPTAELEVSARQRSEAPPGKFRLAGAGQLNPRIGYDIGNPSPPDVPKRVLWHLAGQDLHRNREAARLIPDYRTGRDYSPAESAVNQHRALCLASATRSAAGPCDGVRLRHPR